MNDKVKPKSKDGYAVLCSVWLCLLCKIKQCIYVAFQFFANISTFTCERKSINAIGSMGTLGKYFIAPLFIFLPCFVEVALAATTEKSAIDSGGIFVASKNPIELSPGVLIEKADVAARVETFPELSSSDISSLYVAATVIKKSDKTSEQYSASDGVDVINYEFNSWHAVYFLICISPLLFNRT